MRCLCLLYPHYKTMLNLCSLIILFISFPCQAELLLSSTRIIFPSNKIEKNYQIKNQGSLPIMVQAWIDQQTEGGFPETANGPFVVIPPVFRLEPGSLQSLRIIYNRKKLPENQESLFWLNLYEIPSKPKNIPEEYSVLTVTVKTQIKLLFRPEKIGIPNDIKAKLHFVFHTQAGKVYLRITNSTPFYITIKQLELMSEQNMMLSQSLFIAPNSTQHVQVENFSQLKKGRIMVRFIIIDDEGNDIMGTQAIADKLLSG